METLTPPKTFSYEILPGQLHMANPIKRYQISFKPKLLNLHIFTLPTLTSQNLHVSKNVWLSCFVVKKTLHNLHSKYQLLSTSGSILTFDDHQSVSDEIIVF